MGLPWPPRTLHLTSWRAPLPALARRRPFLIKSLENTMCKFLKSLEFFDETGRKKISMGEPPLSSYPPSPSPNPTSSMPSNHPPRLPSRLDEALTLLSSGSHRHDLLQQAGRAAGGGV